MKPLIEVPTADDPLAQYTTRPLVAADLDNIDKFEAAYEDAKDMPMPYAVIPAEPAPKPNIHVMIDLETLGTGPTAIPISIGAVKFNPTNRHAIMESFHVGIDAQSCADLGLKIDVGTALWWMDPERQEAFKQWFAMLKYPLPLALDGFAQWFGPASLPTWGNGASFDNVILRNAFKACGMKEPWGFHHDRCFRTLKNLHPGVKVPPMPGTAHNALHDAVYQVQWFHEITMFGDFEEIA